LLFTSLPAQVLVPSAVKKAMGESPNAVLFGFGPLAGWVAMMTAPLTCLARILISTRFGPVESSVQFEWIGGDPDMIPSSAFFPGNALTVLNKFGKRTA
jgi:hypothetical protein